MKELLAIQKQLKAPKDEKNNFGGYSYRTAEKIYEAVKPLLGECQLVVSDDIVAVGDRVYVKATATISNGKESVSVTAFAREEEAKKGMDASQITGAASSYARKYAMCGLFLIDGAKDADALNTSEAYTEKKSNLPEDIVKLVSEANDVNALKNIWEFYADWQGNKEFRTLVNDRKKQLK